MQCTYNVLGCGDRCTVSVAQCVYNVLGGGGMCVFTKCVSYVALCIYSALGGWGKCTLYIIRSAVSDSSTQVTRWCRLQGGETP